MSAKVPRLFPGETIVCVASGPSLTREDVEFCRGKARVIVVNASYVLAPWADAIYAADAKVWRWYWKKAPAGYTVPMRECAGLKYSLTRASEVVDRSITVLRRGPDTGLSLNPAVLNTGKNSGYQAINLAVLFGAARVLLLGYDMQVGPAKREHWHGDHPNSSRSPYIKFRSFFPSLVEPLAAAGVAVINCSRVSALDCFPRMTLEDALAGAREEAIA